jgi:hypothetical protein
MVLSSKCDYGKQFADPTGVADVIRHALANN